MFVTTLHHQPWNEIVVDKINHKLNAEILEVGHTMFLECLHGIRIVSKDRGICSLSLYCIIEKCRL